MRLPFDLSGGDPERDFPALISMLNRASFLERSVLVPLRGQTGAGVGLDGYRRSDTASTESWYASGAVNGTALTTVTAPGTAVVWAVPFVAESPQPWDRIAFQVTANGAAGAKARVGIYAALTDPEGLLYPGGLLLDGGTVAVDAGAVSRLEAKTIDFTPVLGALYFAAFQISADATLTVRAIPAAAVRPAWGWTVTPIVNGRTNILGSVAYDAAGMPAMFPTGGLLSAGVVPAIFIRHAASVARTRTYAGDYVDQEGMVLRRAMLVSPTALSGGGETPWYTVQAAIRRGTKNERFGTFDSRNNRLSAGGSFPLSAEDLDQPLQVGDVPEVIVTQQGFPWADLSDLVVRFVLAYSGGSD